jgi:hypothetical protein
MDSTFSGNLPATGGSIASAGTLTLTDNIFVEPASGSSQCTAVTTACPANPSAPDASGNFDGPNTAFNLSPLGYYGGLTPTLLPLPGSPAICGGKTAGAKNVSGNALTTDERGFGIDPSCGTGLVDAGAVQTHYLTVTTTADNGSGTCGSTCTLHDAMTAANAAGHADIVFANGLSGTITLLSSLPSVTGTTDIVGPGPIQLTISGNNTYAPFSITGGTLDISGLTIAYGKSASSGGAVNNASGTLTLTNTFLSGNSAATSGGAVENSGTLLITDSTFFADKAPSGSAIHNTGVVGATYSTFSGNTASTSGGISNSSGATLTLANSTFASNTGGTGPGILNSGALAMTNSILDASSACSGTGCPSTSGSGNVVGATHLAPPVTTADRHRPSCRSRAVQPSAEAPFPIFQSGQPLTNAAS